MSSKSLFRRLAVLVALASSLASAPALAQAERAYSLPGNRVLSIDEESDHHSLVIRLQKSSVAGAPVFKYLPGEGGETVLTADFVGLAWNSAPKIIRLISSENGLRSADRSGIKEVRVSQFLASPAVLRISFVARDPRLLKSVAIASGPGLLKVSWPARPSSAQTRSADNLASSSSSAPNLATAPAPNLVTAPAPTLAIAPALSPAPAPSPAEGATRHSSSGWLHKITGASKNADDSGARGSQTSSQSSSDFLSALAQATPARAPAQRPPSHPAAGPAPTLAPRAAAAEVDPSPEDGGGGMTFRTLNPISGGGARSESSRSSDTARGGDQEEPPTISLVPCDNMGSGATVEVFRVEMPAGHELNFRAFRLHDPERYVIDMPNCRALADAALPDVSTSSLVSSLRVGVPNDADGVGRLVLQLQGSDVNVVDNFTPGSNYLSVTLGKGLMLGSESGQTSEKFSSPDINPGPILVPRAPSECVVVLDAGHGGSDPGAVRADIQEKDITLGIIEKLKKILEAKGARVVLTRHDDTFVSLEDRVKITNQVGPNLFLSVHINSLESTSNIFGIETYFQTPLSHPLAERVHASLVAGLGAPDRNIRRARFYVINHTPVPAILAEVGYITNKAERDRLISSDYQQKVASALARGVMLYLQDSGVSSLANSGRLPRTPQ